jgi:hypothetical protein
MANVISTRSSGRWVEPAASAGIYMHRRAVEMRVGGPIKCGAHARTKWANSRGTAVMESVGKREAAARSMLKRPAGCQAARQRLEPPQLRASGLGAARWQKEAGLRVAAGLAVAAPRRSSPPGVSGGRTLRLIAPRLIAPPAQKHLTAAGCPSQQPASPASGSDTGGVATKQLGAGPVVGYQELRGSSGGGNKTKGGASAGEEGGGARAGRRGHEHAAEALRMRQRGSDRVGSGQVPPARTPPPPTHTKKQLKVQRASDASCLQGAGPQTAASRAWGSPGCGWRSGTRSRSRARRGRR